MIEELIKTLRQVKRVDKDQSGHRRRLRERFLKDEDGSHSDEALLELLLTIAIGRKDVKPLSLELIRLFGSLSNVLSASPDELIEVKGMGQSSIVLLKAIEFIRSGSVSPERNSQAERADIAKQKMPKNIIDEAELSLKPIQKPFIETPSVKKSIQRKFQVSNGYLLEFDQLTRVLNFLFENRNVKKISRKLLQEHTGLAERQVESLISMGAAMDLIRPGIQILSPIGLLISKYDIFMEKSGTLEWCHYLGAGSYKNLIWYEVFNHILSEESVLKQDAWHEKLRTKLTGQYSERTIKKRIPQEVRFVIDAYLNRNFNKLELLNQTSDEKLYLRRYSKFEPLVLCAMVYDFFANKETLLYQIEELTVAPGSPAILFGLNVVTFRQQIEVLHNRGWLRYETTHNLDQIRLKPKFSTIEFLSAYYENREPRENSQVFSGDFFK